MAKSKYGFQIKFLINKWSSNAIRKKEETHRMTEENRDFAHLH